MHTSQRQQELYNECLDSALTTFESLLSSPNSRAWKPVSVVAPSVNSKSRPKDTNQNGIGGLLSEVSIHKRTLKGTGEVLRASAEFAVGDNVRMQDFVAVLQRPETRATWDRLVEASHILEMTSDASTMVCKTDFKLGWPASPRDSVTISRLLSDRQTVILLATSLPRYSDEPAFIRPAPPFVRSQVHLHAWCIQLLDGKARISCFLNWNLRGALLSHSPSELGHLLSSFLNYVASKSETIPLLLGFGKAVDVSNNVYKAAEEVLTVDYLITYAETESEEEPKKQSIDELAAWKEWKRLERSIEISLDVNSHQGWDVQVTIIPQGKGAEVAYTAAAERSILVGEKGRTVLRIQHAKLLDPEHSVKVQLVVRRLVGGKSLRINGSILSVETVEDRDPSSAQKKLLDSPPLPINESLMEVSPSQTSNSSAAFSKSITSNNANTITTLVKRSYTYFASLLQEPEAKWRHVTEQKGVSVSQLNSIDPTVTIYRAQAIYVGVGVWDLFGTIVTPGSRLGWDKGLEDMVLLDDLNELSSLWHTSQKAVWPAWARDSVTVRTSYKSSTSVHIFSFSTEDKELFPCIPAPAPNVIRSQTVIQGWSVEALSPTTTQITLIEQTDSKGWSTKGWTYQSMVNAVSGVGDLTIKSGSPPVLTRLLGAKIQTSKYDPEKGSLKLEYQAVPLAGGSSIECEVRCDVDVWANSLDIVTDPPPARISCLSRHRLASGGGCWITIEHEGTQVNDDPMLVLVRRGPSSRAKGTVFVNGAKIKVDTEELGSDEVKVLSAKKRMKSSPVPLDQWPSANSSRTSTKSDEATIEQLAEAIGNPRDRITPAVAASPLSRPPATPVSAISEAHPVKQDLPSMCYALEALSSLQTFHAEQGPDIASPAPGWTAVAEKSGGIARKKIVPLISETVPVFRADKILEGLTAEQVMSIVSHQELKAQWDDRIESYQALESYGSGCSTGIMITKAPFIAFRKRIFHLSSASAQFRVPSASASSSTSTVYLFATASCPALKRFASGKINAPAYPDGVLFFEGWTLETVDPYTSDTYAIPSTRASYFSCMDWGNVLPFSVGGVGNYNALRPLDNIARLAQQCIIPQPTHPTAAVQIEGPLSSDDSDECVWCLDGTKAEEPSYVKASSQTGSAYSLTVLAPKLVISSFPSISRTATSPPASRRLPTLLRASTTQPALPKLTTSGGNEPHGLRHETSTSSLRTLSRSSAPPTRSTQHTPSSSLSQLSLPYPDYLLAEIVVSYEDYKQGYAVTTEMRATDAEAEGGQVAFDITSSPTVFPVRMSVHELRATTLSSMTASSHQKRQHLLRFTLPTAQFTNPLTDPLRDGFRPTYPAWYQQLTLSSCLLSVKIEQIADAGSVRRILLNGTEVVSQSAQQSKAVLDAREEDDWSLRLPRLSRVPRRIRRTDEKNAPVPLLPILLQTPNSVASRFLPTPPPIALDEGKQSPVPASPALSAIELAAEGTKRSVSGNATVGSGEKETATGLTTVLNTYPLSLATNAFTSTSTSTNSRAYSLNALILVALVAFLLGSFLRSLLTPADFILYPRSTEVDLPLLRALDPERRWKEARRILEFRLPFIWERDIMLAVVKKR